MNSLRYKLVNLLLASSLLCTMPGALGKTGSTAKTGTSAQPIASTSPVQSSGSVPSSYTQEYAQLNQAIDTFITSMDSRSATAAVTRFGSGLDSANGAAALSYLQPNAINPVIKQLNCFQQLGIQSVNICIPFPVFCQEFWTEKMNSSSDQQALLLFYENVIQQCRARGMTVLIESHPVPNLDNTTFESVASSFVSSLSAAQYQQYMAEHVNNVASIIHPDVISIVNEPNTDLLWSGQSVYNHPEALTAFVQTMANQIAQANSAKHTNILAAAGAPTWDANAQSLDDQFLQIANLGAIDIHNYFAGGNDCQLATTLADNAHNANKQVVVSECWLAKVGTGTPPDHPIGAGQSTEDRAVTAFSFWEPLDETYMSAFARWCKIEHPAIFTFFYPQLLFATLNYNTYSSQSDQAIVQAEMAAKQAAINSDSFTPVGQFYARLIKQQ